MRRYARMHVLKAPWRGGRQMLREGRGLKTRRAPLFVLFCSLERSQTRRNTGRDRRCYTGTTDTPRSGKASETDSPTLQGRSMSGDTMKIEPRLVSTVSSKKLPR